MPSDPLHSLRQLEDFVARLADVEIPSGMPALAADVRNAVAASKDPQAVKRLEHVSAAATDLVLDLQSLAGAASGSLDPTVARRNALTIDAWCQLIIGGFRETDIHLDIADSVALGIVNAPDDVELAVQTALECFDERLPDCGRDAREWVAALTRGLF